MNQNVNVRFTKAKFRLKITEVMKAKEGDETRLKVVNVKSDWCRGADFERSLREDFNNKVQRKIEFCDKEPENFSLGTIYIRKDGKAVYIFNEIENNEESSSTEST